MKTVRSLIAAVCTALAAGISAPAHAGDIINTPRPIGLSAAPAKAPATGLSAARKSGAVRRPAIAVAVPPGWKVDPANGFGSNALLLRNKASGGAILLFPIRMTENSAWKDCLDALGDVQALSQEFSVGTTEGDGTSVASTAFKATTPAGKRSGRVTALNVGPYKDMVIIVAGGWQAGKDKAGQRAYKQFVDSITLVRAR